MPPNILFLMSDEHRADITGYAGDPVVRTPTLDGLARTGAVFGNAYTASPICIPGRQAMMSGQFPRTCGCEIFAQDLPTGHMTFARRFSQYAYHTVAAGKLHHTGPDQMQGWSQRIGSAMQVAPHFIEARDENSFSRHTRGLSSVKWSDTKEVLRAGVGHSPHIIQDEYALTGALDFIQQYFTDPYYDRQQPERPLLLKVSLNQPHYPYFTSEEKFTYYLNRVEPFLDELVFDHPFLGQKQVRVDVDASPRELRRAVAGYYGMIETIDEMYGSLLAALEQVGQDIDDWIIVYTSDHGEMLGEHGIWEKQKFFEASARVPLIIRWPKSFAGGRVVQENVNLCDLFATLCELCQIPIPEGLDSRSLAPLLRGEEADWRNESISQFGARNLMIKWDDLKYQYYGEEMPEVLFDLERCPSERQNFIADPRYADVLTEFRRRRFELGFGPGAQEKYVNAGY